MRYLVTYDISDNKARDRVARILSKYGVRVQFSCFEIDCKEDKLLKILREIKEIIEPTVDSIYIFPITKNAEQSIYEIGIRRRMNGKII